MDSCRLSTPPAPSAVVFDAYGTLLSIPDPRRPYGGLRAFLESRGADVGDFAHRAMTSPQGLAALAHGYGVQVPMDVLARLEADLWADLQVARPYPDAERALRHALNQGATVVVASNLALPYALPVRSLLAAVSREMFAGPSPRLRTALSFQLGQVKPHPGFYAAVADHLAPEGVAPSRIFMIGDRQAEDVDGPHRAGWNAWHLDRAGGADLFDAPWDTWFPPHRPRA